MTSSEPSPSRFADRAKLIASFLLPLLILSGCSRVIRQPPISPPPPTAQIFVTSSGANAVFAYRPGANGNVAPDLRIGPVLSSPSGVARGPRGRLYVVEAGLNTISIFAPGAHGDMPPMATIGGENTQLSYPADIVLDSSGRIYVVNPGYTPNYVGSIMVYPAHANGNVAPIDVISGPRTGLRNCSAIALDSRGRIYVANGGGKFPGSVNVYPAGAHGDIAPIAIIRGPKTGLSSPNGIVVGPKGRIYVTNLRKVPFSSAVEVFPAGSNGDVAPIAAIRGSRTQLSNPQGVALDSKGDIYVANERVLFFVRRSLPVGFDSVNVYPAGSNGNVAPTTLIRGKTTGLDSPGGIAVDPGGDIYVANTGLWSERAGTVTVYRPARSGDVKPLATIRGGPATGVIRPSAIALDSAGNIYVSNISNSITVYPAGTDHNVPPVATIKGANRRLCPTGIAIGPKGTIYAANPLRGSYVVRPGENLSITTYPPGSNGNVAPSTVISGPRTRLYNPPSIAVDSAGNIYVANGLGGYVENGRWAYRVLNCSVTVYRAGSNGDEAPIATIVGPHTGLGSSHSSGGSLGIALDPRGRIYVVNSGGGFQKQGSVTVYPPLENLSKQPGYPDVKPIATIAGAETGLAHPQAIALDSLGRIYVLSEDIEAKPEIDRITVYPALGNRSGNLDERPIATIEGSNTELDTSPVGIAVLGPTTETPAVH